MIHGIPERPSSSRSKKMPKVLKRTKCASSDGDDAAIPTTACVLKRAASEDDQHDAKRAASEGDEPTAKRHCKVRLN